MNLSSAGVGKNHKHMGEYIATGLKSAGIDFGTSNSAAAIATASRRVGSTLVKLDPTGPDPELLRSVLFFPDGCDDIYVGSQAIARYAADEEGRFIQSVKSFLPSTLFSRTSVRRRSYTLPELVMEILIPMRQRVEEALQGSLDKVVFGRPALFSEDPKVDAMAQARLAEAAELAGFPSPTFLIEPIAAALKYEETLHHDELVLVGDFGAGTSDFTLIQLGQSRAGNLDRKADVVASTGVYVGGDNFDAVIVEHALLQHFGAGSTYLDFTKRSDLPAWIVRKMTRWHELAMLREPTLMNFLRRARATSSDPVGLQNFLSLLEENLGYNLFQAVEACKRQLSDQHATTFSFYEGDIELEVLLLRSDFETWMQPLLYRLDAAVTRVLAASPGRMPDAVFLTGGTSRIPAVVKILEARFGKGRLRSGDTFTSVAAGLGRAASTL
jgi:hypothetical chaperone protein